jgi:succinate dehydrogenase hydrophobic anchor subunit
MKTIVNFFKIQFAIFLAIYTLLWPFFAFLAIQSDDTMNVMTQNWWLVVNAAISLIGFWHIWIAPRLKK